MNLVDDEADGRAAAFIASFASCTVGAGLGVLTGAFVAGAWQGRLDHGVAVAANGRWGIAGHAFAWVDVFDTRAVGAGGIVAAVSGGGFVLASTIGIASASSVGDRAVAITHGCGWRITGNAVTWVGWVVDTDAIGARGGIAAVGLGLCVVAGAGFVADAICVRESRVAIAARCWRRITSDAFTWIGSGICAGIGTGVSSGICTGGIFGAGGVEAYESGVGAVGLGAAVATIARRITGSGLRVGDEGIAVTAGGWRLSAGGRIALVGGFGTAAGGHHEGEGN